VDVASAARRQILTGMDAFDGNAANGDWPLATRVQAYTAFALGVAALLVAIATPLLYIGTWTMGTAAIVLAKLAERGYPDLSTWTRWAAGIALLLDLCVAGARLFIIGVAG
jgi:hypothetical protein